MEEILIQRRLTKVPSLDKVKLHNNQVLLKPLTDNLNATTKAGVYKSSVELWKNQMLSGYSNRRFSVIKVCENLVFWSKANKTSETALRYKCNIEVGIKDEVIIGYQTSIDYDGILVGDEEYILCSYGEIRVTMKPSGEYIPVNGWVLYSHPEISRSSILIDPNPQKDLTKGKVILVGAPNKSYIVKERKWVDLESNVDLKVGDTFIKKDKAHALILENPVYATYPEKDVFLIQRKDIIAIV